MKKLLIPEIREVIESVHYRPAVSIILPFEPKMDLKTRLVHSLKTAIDKVERELMKNYPGETGMLVIRKLRTIIKDLNFNSFKKSIAIYVSPVFEKVLYLDIPVEEKIVVDDSFEIRDLVYNKKHIEQYLVLLLNSKESKIYLGNSGSFENILSMKAATMQAQKDPPGRIANFTDISGQKEIFMEQFLHRVDNTLNIILNAYHLPLFVLCTEKIMGHFKSLTKHKNAVVEYIRGNYEHASLQELKELMNPIVADWKRVQQRNLLNQLEEAAGNNKLAVGMKDVWREALGRRGRLLVVENNFQYAAQHSKHEDVIYKAVEPYNKFSYIKDAVDDAIEKVLENGGDVEFVEDGLLKDHHHIALIQYF